MESDALSAGEMESTVQKDTEMEGAIIIGSSDEESSSLGSDEEDETEGVPVQGGSAPTTGGRKFGIPSGLLLDAADPTGPSVYDEISDDESPDDEDSDDESLHDETAEGHDGKLASILQGVSKRDDQEGMTGFQDDDLEMAETAQTEDGQHQPAQPGLPTAPFGVDTEQDPDTDMQDPGGESQASSGSTTPDPALSVGWVEQSLLMMSELLPEEHAATCRRIATIFAEIFASASRTSKAERDYNRRYLDVYDRLGEGKAVELEHIVQAEKAVREQGKAVGRREQVVREEGKALNTQIERWTAVKEAQEEELRLAKLEARQETAAAHEIIAERDALRRENDALRRENERLRAGGVPAPAPLVSGSRTADIERHLRLLPFGELLRVSNLASNLLTDAFQRGGQTVGTETPGELPVTVKDDASGQPQTYIPRGLHAKGSTATLQTGLRGRGSHSTLDPGDVASTALRSITPEVQITIPERIRQPRRPEKDSPVRVTPTATRFETERESERDLSPSPGSRRGLRPGVGSHTPRQDRRHRTRLERLSEEPAPSFGGQGRMERDQD